MRQAEPSMDLAARRTGNSWARGMFPVAAARWRDTGSC